MDPQTIVIKKYGNRRLYDSTNSRYVNLDEVAQMVREGHDVHVVDATTGEDRTRAVLTQIVIDQSKVGETAFPVDVLRQMVAATGRVTNEAALSYMNAALDIYRKAALAISPTPPAPPVPPANAPAAPSVPATEVGDLKKRIDELESIVSGIKSGRRPPAARARKRR